MRGGEILLAITTAMSASCDAKSSSPRIIDDGASGASLRFKSGSLLENHFASALDLGPEDVCLELGERRCAQLHAVSIGGVDAYRRTIYEPASEPSLSTPLIVERMALSACVRRVSLDFAEPEEARVFRGTPAEIVERLYTRTLQRRPTEAEVEVLEKMRAEVVSRGEADALRVWSVLSCVAVTTSMEALFY